MSLSHASNFIINEATFVDNSFINGRDAALQLLSQYVAQGATHDSYAQDDAPKCHPETRVQLLSDINEWMIEPNKETGILYLHGPAGAGKSCIARSTCAQACPRGFFLASFFFWRGSDERNNIMKLFTTLVYQLAMLNDDLAGLISDAIQRNPRIVNDATARCQFEKLLLEPCRTLADRTGGRLNGAIIIDGLDECIDKDAQASLIILLANMIKRERFPLGFLVTSRPELHLKEVWDTENMAPVTQFISLSNIGNTSDDIRTVLESGFSRIWNDRWFRRALQSVPRPWPSRDIIETLVERSSEQFIYAATVLKFVSTRSRNPNAQLQIVLGLQAGDTSPLADLDALYYEILSRSDDKERTIKVLSFLLAIMDILSVPPTNIDISLPFVQTINADANKQLLIAEQLLSLPPGEAFLALNDLHSLIDLGDSDSNGYRPLSFYHASFRDFLFTIGSSKEFYIDIPETHAQIVRSCLKLLCLPTYDIIEQHVGWLYSFFVWPIHMYARGGAADIRNFEQPVQGFTADAKVHMSCLHLIDALTRLGVGKKQRSLNEIAGVLTGFRRLSATTFKCAKWCLWVLSDPDFTNELSSFKKSSICCPLLSRHLNSYQMDVLTVKRALAIHAIVPFSTLFASGLYSRGTIHELSSLPEIQEDMIDSDLFDASDVFLDFLSNPRASGVFNCTPEDFAEAYTDIISIATPLSSERQEDQYSELLRDWTYSLRYIKPAATPAFLAALKSAAQDVHDQPRLNRSLSHFSAENLLEWLESLVCPPQDIIDAWRKALDKALQNVKIAVTDTTISNPPLHSIKLSS